MTSFRSAGQILLLALVIATIGCDRVTKHFATLSLAGKATRSYAADTVRLAYAENTGGFLSLGATLPVGPRTAIFTVATGLMLLMLTVFALRSGWGSGPSALGLAMFVAGGASNWFDRIVQGRVVDFLNLGIGPLRTGVFNIADVAIMGGAFLFIAAEINKHRSQPRADRDDNAA